MRTELPRIVVEAGITDTYILYTDCDVMFMDEVTVDLQRFGCYFFAVAPEFDPKDYHRMNTGVMLMNPKNLISMEKNFRKFLLLNLEKFPCWDQSAYQWFYKGPRKRSSLSRRGWDRLPVEFNWKPYWGDYTNAKIIHFHGPKPFRRKYFNSSDCPVIVRELAKGCYHELCALWDKALDEAGR